MSNWRWASACCRGTSHAAAGTRKQDATSSFVTSTEKPVFVSIVADGAGSASYGGQGAIVACRILTLNLRQYLNTKSVLPSDETIMTWVDEIRDAIGLAAIRRNKLPRDFASTLIMTLVSDGESLCAHIGDGGVVVHDQLANAWKVLSWPQNGEYASTTFFLTDDPVPNLRVTRSSKKIDAVFAFTDGIEHLVLDFRTSLPHEPFFETMSQPVRQVSAKGEVRELSGKLSDYLNSGRVNALTDDDKTLIIAVR